MSVRSTILAAAILLSVAAPALAQRAVDPAAVLAAKRGHGFADRTARLSSIMGAELSAAAPIQVPTKPVWKRPVRRDADALAGVR